MSEEKTGPVSFRTEPGPSALTDSTKDPQEILKAMSGANAHMAEKVGKAITQLREDRDQFALYAELHRQKGTEDGDAKSATNAALVGKIDTLLGELLA